MKYKIKIIEEKIKNSLKELGIETEVTINPSNRPELGDYQFNGVMPLAKSINENPLNLANNLSKLINEYPEIKESSVAGPGFINLTFTDEFLIDFLNESNNDITINYRDNKEKTIFLDYGGPNVAKILHVGHLRSANIGEALKRLCQALGYKTISDIHLGDWGRPMGMVILEIKTRYPDLAYFKEDYKGEEIDFNLTNEDLLELYPIATTKAKENEEIMEEARKINLDLQNKHLGYYTLWQKIVETSLNEIKKIYQDLNVDFDLWEGESDNSEYLDELFEYLYAQNSIETSEGAKVINVSETDDKLEIPPLIMVKSNGAVSYEATDLAAIYERTKNYNLDEIWYVVDKRQSLHFTQVFRAAIKTKIVSEETKLIFNGFGTMNGKDGKPFKTRDGGTMPLHELIKLVTSECEKRLDPNILENRNNISKTIAVAAIKYADLLPFRGTDYNFDLEKFTDLNGKTGPYLLYSTIRMKSLLKKAHDNNFEGNNILNLETEIERKIALAMLDLKRIIKRSYENYSLNEIAEYIYKITNLYNNFYAENKVLTEKDTQKRTSWLTLTKILYDNNVYLLNILGINIPEKM